MNPTVIKRVVLFLLILCAIQVQAQFNRWYVTDSNEQPSALDMDNKNGYIIAGSTSKNSMILKYPLLMRVDKNGNLIWAKTYLEGNGLSQFFTDVTTTPWGTAERFVTVGRGNGTSATGVDASFMITTGDGTLLRSKLFYTEGQDVASHVEPFIHPGMFGYIIAGTTDSPTDYGDVHVVKVTAGGILLESAVFLEPLLQKAYWITPTLDNGFLLVGTTNLPGSCDNRLHNILVVKLTSNLHVQWDRTFDLNPADGHSEDRPYVVREDANEEIHIGGTSSVSDSTGLVRSVPFQMHLSKNGTLLWVKCYEIDQYPITQVFSLLNNVTLSDGSTGYVLGGNVHQPGTALASQNEEALVFQTDNSGDVMWGKTYPHIDGAGTHHAVDLTENKLNGYSFAAWREDNTNPSTGHDIHVVEADSLGNSGSPCENSVVITSYQPQVCSSTLNLKLKIPMQQMDITPLVENHELETYDCEGVVSAALSAAPAGILPNPAQDVISIPGLSGNVVIYDLQGMARKGIAYRENDLIDIADLPAGIYIVKVVDAAGAVHEFRLVKN